MFSEKTGVCWFRTLLQAQSYRLNQLNSSVHILPDHVAQLVRRFWWLPACSTAFYPHFLLSVHPLCTIIDFISLCILSPSTRIVFLVKLNLQPIIKVSNTLLKRHFTSQWRHYRLESVFCFAHCGYLGVRQTMLLSKYVCMQYAGFKSPSPLHGLPLLPPTDLAPTLVHINRTDAGKGRRRERVMGSGLK